MNAIKDDVIAPVHKELESANEQFPLFCSVHEGYAVIKEEIEEAEDEVADLKDNLVRLWKRVKENNSKVLKNNTKWIMESE